MIKVLVADDHAVVRAGVRALFAADPELQVVGEAADGAAALEMIRKKAPDVLLADLTMPGVGGLEAIAKLRKESPGVKVLVLSMHGSAELVRSALAAGANGYVVKGSGLEELTAAVHAVSRGERYLDASARQAVAAGPVESPIERLTAREREVLTLVAKGATNRDIAGQLGLSPKTVDTHRQSAMRKLDLHDAQAVTRFAVRHGLVPAE
jgi:DNA-binding NarL/FixJ family response regulator